MRLIEIANESDAIARVLATAGSDRGHRRDRNHRFRFLANSS